MKKQMSNAQQAAIEDWRKWRAKHVTGIMSMARAMRVARFNKGKFRMQHSKAFFTKLIF